MRPVQPAGILHQRALPRHRQSEKERVEPRIVEALADVLPGGQHEPLLIRWDCGDSLRHLPALFRTHAASQNYEVPCGGTKLCLKILEMVRPFGEEERRPTVFESIEHVIDDELISRRVSHERPIEILNRRLARIASNAELRLPDNQAVRKRPSCGLVLGIDGEADRS